MRYLLIGLVAVSVAGCFGDAPTQPKPLRHIVSCTASVDTVWNTLPTGPRFLLVEHRCP